MKNRHEVISSPALRDRDGAFIPYCCHPKYHGIVRYCQYKTCEKKNCDYYIKFRPEKITDIRVDVNDNSTKVHIRKYGPNESNESNQR